MGSTGTRADGTGRGDPRFRAGGHIPRPHGEDAAAAGEERRAAEERARQQAQLRFSVKDAQAGVCRFVRLKNLRTVSPNRHTAYKRAERLCGLQVENKLYYIKGGTVKYVWLNKPGNKVEEVFDGIPKWAPAALAAQYEAAHAAEVRDE